ncbi:MAG: hypothetical protein JO250_12410 [Armatimonadetes bacterium]|nr:hypothetical protein [Armatimonadota bacterium]
MTERVREAVNFQAMSEAMKAGRDRFPLILPDWAGWDIAPPAGNTGLTFRDRMALQDRMAAVPAPTRFLP